MTFHDATFRLLGSEPRFSLTAKNCLDESQHRLGITLPASVRDWYERESAIRVLADYSNEDPPIEVSQFELIRWQSKTLMPIRYENQGACTWAIEIDDSDNPPVLVDVDTNGTHWNLLAKSFSAYVYSCVWDYKIVLNQPALVQAQNRKLSDVARKELFKRLTPEVTTHGWPGRTQLRFRDSGFGVLIWDSEEQADWFVGASDNESLRLGLEAVWELDSVGNSFYDCTESGRQVLAQMQRRPNKTVNPSGGSGGF